MTLDFAFATQDELDELYEFYEYVIDATLGAQHSPQWTLGVYPTKDDLLTYIMNNALFTVRNNGALVGACGISNTFPEGYDKIAWPSGASQDKVSVLHLLCTSPKYRGQGIARALITQLCEYLRTQGKQAIRLDVIEGNLPAAKLYESCGFTHVKDAPIYYEDTGWLTFLLYELEL